MNRETDEPKDRDKERERDSSRDSKDSGREVRCGCQYFQTDSLLPERQCLVGTKPVSRPSSRQSHHEVGGSRMTMGDHEYEPITPMATQQPTPVPPPVVEVTDSEVKQKPKKGRSTRIQYIDNDPNIMFIPLHGSSDEDQENDEKHYLRIPTDEELIIPQDVDADADQEDNQDDQEDRDMEDEELSAQEIQNRMEERFFAPTPTTTESRTDCEINTSQIDSSGLEDLPLKREARKAGDMPSKGFQQRIRSQAGRLRTKIRNISKPKINLPDKPKFHLPERPKFNLPERPKFKMPERPKISLPERPKFNLPERPKFNMPQRPKISMPNIQLGKTRTSSLRRPLRDRNQLHSAQSTAGSKKNLLDSLNFRTYPRFFNKKKRLAEQNAKLKGKRAMTPPPRMETDSIPSSPGSRRGPFGQRWKQCYKDIKFADDENQSNQSEKQGASLKATSSFEDDEPVEDDSTAFRDPDFRAATLLEVKKKTKARSSNSLMDSDREQRSSGSSSDRHRAGVLEEIDSDEFFLREKGLSREDVDVSRFLSNEIRDAFRSPKNALAHLDAELQSDEDDEEICEVNSHARQQISHHAPTEDKEFERRQQAREQETESEVEPLKPSRSRSLRSKRSSQSKTSIDIKDENTNYNTYPPTRPSRSRKQSMQSSVADKQSINTTDIKDLELELKEGSDENEAHLDVIRIPSVPSLDEADAGKLISGRESMNEVWPQETQPPLPPKRRKSTKDLTNDNDSIINEICPQDKWTDEVNIQAMVPSEVTALQMLPIVATVTPLHHYDYDTPPVAPIRKARSRGTSLADEDRTSRGAESLVSETQSYPAEEIATEESKQETKEDNFGYAIVEKPEHKTIEKPERHKRNGNNKPPRPPPPSRRKRAATQMLNLKNQGIQFFFTYPRRAMKSLHRPPPVRPVRNYSTIGPSQTLPSRPPRRTKVFREPVYADGDSIPFMDESEKETLDSSTPKIEQNEEIIPKNEPIITKDEIEETKETTGSNDETKDLQSGDVIEKMKSRPLPAPPRPARKSKSDLQLQSDTKKLEEVNDIENKENEEEIIITERIDIQINPQKEITENKSITTIKTEEEKTVTEIIPKKTSPEIKQETEKKEGPLAALKEMISQKKKEFFEPKKETTIKTETVVTKVESKVDEGSLFKIIPLKGANGESESKVEETNISTQTEPLPEGYIVDEFAQTDEHSITRSKTPELLKLTQISESKTENTGSSTPAQQIQQSPAVQEVHTVIEKKVVVMPDPDTEVSFLKAQKLQVSELDVEKLNVSELQAKKISVSDIDSVAMQVSELSSKSGNLVVSGVELPPEFLKNLASSISAASTSSSNSQQEQIQASTQTSPQTKESETTSTVTTTESNQQTTQPPPVVVYPSQTPIVVYPPQTNPSGQSSIAVHPAIIPQIFNPDYASVTHNTIPRTRSPPRNLSKNIPSHQDDSEEDNGSLMPVPKRPHRHHHSHKHSRQSTDDEEERSTSSSSYNQQQLQLQQQTAAQLVRQLLQIWQDSLSNGVIQVIEGINSVFPDGEKRKDAQTAACIILVLIAGLMIVGFGSSDKTVHHHHWDFQFPPPH